MLGSLLPPEVELKLPPVGLLIKQHAMKTSEVIDV
jgi:hypothetical protein